MSLSSLSIFSSLLLLISSFCLSQDTGGLKVWGGLRNDLIGIQTFGGELRNQFRYGGIGTLTLNVKNKNSTSVKVEGSGDLILPYGAQADMLKQMMPRALQLSGSETPLLFDLRKLYAGFFLPFADLFIGRQIINYGEGVVFSPIDVFSTVNVLDLSLKRSGSDVVRLRVPLGDLAGVELTGGFTPSDSKGVGALKLYNTIKGINLSAVGIYKRATGELITGLSFKGDLVAGFYGELSEHFGTDGNHRYVAGMIGTDYSIHNEWFFNAEYLYTQKPVKNNLPARQETQILSTQPPGEHNIFLSGRYAFNELSSVGLSTIADIKNRSGFLTAQYSRDILQNANLIVYGRYFYNGNPGISDALPDMQYGLQLEADF
jgi:hypothetical protein